MTTLDDIQAALRQAATPCDRVLTLFDLGRNHQGQPFVPTPLQAASVNQFSGAPGHGCWDKPGTGKTMTMTLHCLSNMLEGRQKQAVILTPPAVIANWAKFLRGITNKASGKPLSVLEYLGPKRKNHTLSHYHFIIMSYEVFKRG